MIGNFVRITWACLSFSYKDMFFSIGTTEIGCKPSFCLFPGPCIGMDTACSSSLVATHLGHAGLHNQESSVAISAGVNLILVPDTSIHMAQLGALSPTGRSKSFDAAADGYGRGEGCITLVMRRSGEGASIPAYSPLAVLQGKGLATIVCASAVIHGDISSMP